MRNVMPVRNTPTLLSLAISLALSSQAYAVSFTIQDGETVTTQQTLNDNETGTIEAGGELSTSGIVPILVPGDNVIIENNGSITTSGDYEEAIYSYSSSENTTIHNSGSITTSGNYSFPEFQPLLWLLGLSSLATSRSEIKGFWPSKRN